MPATVNEQVVDSVTTDNVKTVAGAGSWALAVRQSEYPAHAKFVDSLREKLLSNVIEEKTSVKEAISISKLLKSESEAEFAGLVAQDATGQEVAKVANTTPPETGIAQQLANLSASLSAVLAMLQAQANAPVAK